MKILYKNMGFGGGAPRSLLEYAKIAKKRGYEVIAVGEYTKEPSFYNDEGIITYDIPHFRLKTPIKNLKNIYNYYKVLKRFQPDLIHTITSFENMVHKSLEELFDVPVIYTIPGGEVDKTIPLILKETDIIVFSEENRQSLINYGYDNEKIRVITNRIDFSKFENGRKGIDSYSDIKAISLLLISRLSDGKMKSVEKVFRLIEEISYKYNNVELKVLGDGPYLGEIYKIASDINKKTGREVIKVLGYKTDVVKFIEKSHIVFGKGRGIIEATGLERYAVVVNEDMKSEIVTSDNVNRMSVFNFTARDIKEKTDDEKLFDLVDKIQEHKVDYNELKEINKKVRKKYDINEVRDEIINIYVEKDKNRKKKRVFIVRLVKFIISYIRIYLVLIKVVIFQ